MSHIDNALKKAQKEKDNIQKIGKAIRKHLEKGVLKKENLKKVIKDIE